GGRELERRWEETLAEQSRLRQQYERFCQERPGRLSAAEAEQIRQLAGDIPQLWEAKSTTAADRQRVVRLLIERIVVEVEGKSERVKLAISWAGGCVSEHELTRPVQRYEQLADYPELLARMEQLRGEGKSMAEVANCLNEE